MFYIILLFALVVVVFLLLSRKESNKLNSKLDELTSDDIEEDSEKEDYDEKITKLDIELHRAGITLSAKQFIRLRIFSTIIIALLLFLLTKNLFLTPLMAIIWYMMPKALLFFAKEKKKRVLEEQIPIALSLVRNSVEAGFSFLQSLEVVAQEMEAPISEEFARVLHENNIGKDLEVSLWNMVERCQSEELKLVVTAVLIQRQVGGNLGDIIDVILETIKDRIQIKGEIRTMTSQGRLSALIIGCLPIFLAVIMTFLNPQYMSPLYHTTIGQFLIGFSLFWEVIGVYFIMKIVRIDF